MAVTRNEANGVVTWDVSAPDGGLPDGVSATIKYDPNDAMPWTMRTQKLRAVDITPADVDRLLGLIT